MEERSWNHCCNRKVTVINALGYATTNDATTNDATTNDATTNAEEYYRPMYHARARARALDVSGLPAFIRATVIVFVIVCKVRLSV
jgi:hypothetical protein